MVRVKLCEGPSARHRPREYFQREAMDGKTFIEQNIRATHHRTLEKFRLQRVPHENGLKTKVHKTKLIEKQNSSHSLSRLNTRQGIDNTMSTGLALVPGEAKGLFVPLSGTRGLHM